MRLTHKRGGSEMDSREPEAPKQKQRETEEVFEKLLADQLALLLEHL